MFASHLLPHFLKNIKQKFEIKENFIEEKVKHERSKTEKHEKIYQAKTNVTVRKQKKYYLQ